MPTITVEDGTLSAAGTANSYIDSTYVDAFATARNLSGWGSLSQPQKDAALLEGMLYLNNERRYQYRGSRMSAAQRTAFPREGASEYRGPDLPNTLISWRLKDAQALLAIRAGGSPGSLQPDLARGGAVQTEKVDVISTTYFEGASPETLISEVDGILAPLCLSQDTLLTVPYQSMPEDPVEFETGTYTNPTGTGDGSLFNLP